MACAVAASIPPHFSIREPKQRCVENLILVWYDPNLNSDEDEKQARKTISAFQHVINWSLLFNDHKTCVEFLSQLIKDQHVFFVVSSSTSISDTHRMISAIHHLVSVDSIYIMGTATTHEHYLRKVKSGFIDTTALREQLQRDTKQCEQDLVRVNEQGEPSFMYSQLLKEILVEDVDESALFVKIYALFCRINYDGNTQELRMIDEFQQTYGKGQYYSSIWWYTRRCFVSRTLTRAIHLFDVEILSVIHFFIRDLHNQLVKIHAENSKYERPLAVYRGQGMQRDDFERIVKKKETYIAFNNFLLTTTDRQVAFDSAQNAFERDLTAILFEMHVDPSLEGISPFARIGQLSCAKKNKNQILFSMHSTFRLEHVEQLDCGIWNIRLKLSSTPNNPVIDQMRKQTQGHNLISRIGALCIEMGEIDKAREIYSSLLLGGVSKDDYRTQAHLHNRLAFIFKRKDQMDLSQYHYNEYVNLTKKFTADNEFECVNTLSSFDTVLFQHGELDQFLNYFEDQRAINLHTSTQDDNLVFTTHTKLASLYRRKGQLEEALKHSKISLDIQLKHKATQPEDLAVAYTNIACVLQDMKNYTEALEYARKALQIREISLRENDPLLAVSHFNLTRGLEQVSRFSEALQHAQQAVSISRKVLASDDPNREMYDSFLVNLQMKNLKT